jgi:hypothetical protein
MSGFWSRKRMGSKVSRSTSRTSAGDSQPPRPKHTVCRICTSFCDLGERQARRSL